MKIAKLIWDFLCTLLNLAFNLYAIYYIDKLSISNDPVTTKQIAVEIAFAAMLILNSKSGSKETKQ